MRKLIVYITLIIVLGFAVREFFYFGTKQNQAGEYNKLNTLFLKENNYDLIIVGSSRAESHFNTFIIDSVTNLNSYNLGLEGAEMELMRTQLESYLLNSKPPKYVVLNIDYHIFYEGEKEDTIYRFPRFFPYLFYNNLLYNNLKKIDKRFFYFKWNPFYSLAHMDDKYIYAGLKGYMGITNKLDEKYYKGFTPIPDEFQRDFSKEKYTSYKSSPPASVYSCIKSIVHICKKVNSKLIFVISPIYYKRVNSITGEEMFMAYIKSIARKNSYIYKDYSTHSLCFNASLFSDPNHLNEKGSTVFSLIFAQDLYKELSK